ncbi:hypothetical protein BG006_002685 [Podila minutissima]|uniref:Uncharacterized protein n=1 Tax=Podila minutissima TaxID=64525 RepID=A0A9P5VGM0_9FUNG|nr:hypothetical protein BG006_002685 [Podila minutissima]
MNTVIAWAKEDRKTVDGRRFEHVSFPSFVKNFVLTDLSSALADYAELLTSSELGARRRQALRCTHDTFTKNRLRDFWTSWTQQLSVDQAQKELDASSAATAKKTAVLAQEASLNESAQSFRALKKDNASTTASLTASKTLSTVSIDNAVTEGEQYEDINKRSCESDTDTGTDEPCIALWSSSKTHPFHPLISYVFKSAQGQHAVLPSSIPNNLSCVLREMYSEALKELGQPGPVVAKKDVLVLLSSIINTVALSGRRFSVSKKISQGSRLPPLDPISADYQCIKALLKDLLKTLHPSTTNTSSLNNRGKPQFQPLKRRVWTLLSEAEEETAKGELVSKASTQARQEAESKYGPTSSTACGRKVDMSIRIRFDDKWRHEVAIFEFKATTATRAVCEKQQKKSVRLNAAILHDLEAKGLDISKNYPIIAEGQALGLDFYALRRYDEVLGAGRSTSKGIALPSHVDQLKAFFESETIFTLLAFKEHLRQYAYEVTDVLANSAPTPFGYRYGDVDEDDEEHASTPNHLSRPSTPPSRKRRPRAFVLFTPSKKNKLGTHVNGLTGDWDDEDNEDD